MEASRQLEVPEVTREELDAYYAALPREWGYSSQCKMTLLGEIRGKRVLDIDEGNFAALLLGFCQHMQRKRCLA